ncbi:TPA: hypothetical protein JBE10_10820 [Legionella pneumophila subsp. pneumophila]|uniref:hypothetical protein n=1 Tax=Legionella pneumophila TaxID=446 RepID=UPI00077078F3|nr:hypothetical protein [Legionella pneumophila]HAT9058529.1 hypothetical protein [Legionella pneumophila subsp. pneumophila]CZG67423.1 Uncharacterised protein [Legionella pneumophila]CZG71976.1 Uncharacterised protein [Legionella pneumophila]CZG89921.1 Uncharacterised protein [Legionella pneumophila]HAT8609148.1 hypothetical protein [Legionella pneumophila]
MVQEKTEYPLDDILIKDVIPLISSQLDKTDEPQELKSLRKRHFPLFRADVIQTNRILARLAQYAFEGNIARVASLLKIRPDLRREVLFTLAGLGAQDEMETILKQHPEDLLVYRPLRDISGAVFEPISLFKHAIWTKDIRYMANMMLDCLPQNEKGEQIRLELVRQYEELMAKGVAYQLQGVRHENERHFNLQPLITALRTYVEKYDNWTVKEREVHWCTVVGLAQTLIPAHIRHHYCDPEEAFWNNPNFKKPKLKRSLELYNWTVHQSQLWTEGLVGLGSDFGIYASQLASVGPRAERGGRQGRAAANLTALTALDEAGTEIDLPALIERLYIPIQNLEDDLGVQDMKF